MNPGLMDNQLARGRDEFEPGRDRRGRVLIGRDGQPISYRMPIGAEVPGSEDGHYIVAPNGAIYGRYTLILFLTELSKAWAVKSKNPFGLGDMGNADLSAVPSHADHAGGLSVDIYVMHKGGVRRSGFVTNKTYVGAKTYDDEATNKLLVTIDTLQGRFPFKWWYFNENKKKYPELQAMGFTKHDNHDDHVHINLADSRIAPKVSENRWTMEDNLRL